VDADQLAVWQTLNPTEKYMSLLETWWFHADSSIFGEGRSWRDEINKNDPDGITTRAQEDFGPILGLAVENFVRALNMSDDAEQPVGQSMIFYYDFGESWEFDVLLQRVVPEEGSPRKPKVVASRGTAPRQWQ
jgi:hypothetical protein